MSFSQIPLSCLAPGKTNPRKVKPEREAHARLVASIRAHGLIHPLVVQPNGQKDQYSVIAGNRRLAALKEIHKGQSKVKIPCMMRKVDPGIGEAISLGENFVREPMHPLDEALAFTRLAQQDGKDAVMIAAEFGVTEHYVRQRMKLADLAKPIAEAYRRYVIDTAVAETFASVPHSEQISIWKEIGGADGADLHRVRHAINDSWINADKAIFDLATLPPGAVSADLFANTVLIERSEFLKAQEAAIHQRRQQLLEEGWSDVVIAHAEQVRDKLYAMPSPKPVYEPGTEKKLSVLLRKCEQLQKKANRMKAGDARLQRTYDRIGAIEEQVEKLTQESPVTYTEQDKSRATSFLILEPSGSVRIEYRIPAEKKTGSGDTSKSDKPLDSDQISDAQRAPLYTAHAMAVRQALLADPHRCKVVAILALHEQIRSESLAIRPEPNDSSLHAAQNQELVSSAKETLAERLSKLDPFAGKAEITDIDAYSALLKLNDRKLDELIALLTVNLITHRLLKPNDLVVRIGSDLKVKLRDHWTPDASWLKRYRKVQLVDLIARLHGSIATPIPDAKHSDLVKNLADLFQSVKSGQIEDKTVADRTMNWIPKDVWKEPQ